MDTNQEINRPFLPDSNKKREEEEADEDYYWSNLRNEIWNESKKIWFIVGPTLISRLANASMSIVSQSYAGHIGDVELASVSIANNVIVGFCWGLLVIFFFTILCTIMFYLTLFSDLYFYRRGLYGILDALIYYC